MYFYGSSGKFSIYQHHFAAFSKICHEYVLSTLSNFPQLLPSKSQFHDCPTPHILFSLSKTGINISLLGFILHQQKVLRSKILYEV